MTSTASVPTHAVAVPTFGKFFLPGPTDVHPEVLEAMIRPMIGHRSSAMEKLLQNVAPKLGAVCRTARPVFIGTNSATGFMEMAVRNGIRRRALSLVNGAFSERFAGIVGACGKECIRLDVPLGAAVEPDMLRDSLKRTPVDAVTCVHSETSTGVLQDVAGYAEVVQEFDDVLLLVDCVTSMVGSPVETDAWKLDFAFTGSQKALALPPGLALGVASERMVERAKTLEERGAYFDLISFLTATTKFQPTNTPAVSLLYALEVQLARIEREGGIEARWKRHDAMRRRVETWAAEHGVTFLPREGRHSWTVSCLRLPEGKHSKDVVADRVAKSGLDLLSHTSDIEVIDVAGKPAELDKAIAGAHALIVRSETRVTASLMARAPNLRVVARAGTGVDTIDVPAATRRGEWDRKRFEGTELRGKTMGVVGLGRIGGHVALARAFGMQVAGH